MILFLVVQHSAYQIASAINVLSTEKGFSSGNIHSVMKIDFCFPKWISQWYQCRIESCSYSCFPSAWRSLMVGTGFKSYKTSIMLGRSCGRTERLMMKTWTKENYSAERTLDLYRCKMDVSSFDARLSRGAVFLHYIIPADETWDYSYDSLSNHETECLLWHYLGSPYPYSLFCILQKCSTTSIATSSLETIRVLTYGPTAA